MCNALKMNPSMLFNHPTTTAPCTVDNGQWNQMGWGVGVNKDEEDKNPLQSEAQYLPNNHQNIIK